jgi:hypothetical protein
MFLRDTIRCNKIGIGSAVAFASKDTLVQDFSTIIDAAGNVINNNKIVFWYYIPNPTIVQDVALHLAVDTSGVNDHIYMVTGGFHAGWNRAEFTKRTNGTANSTNIVKVQFRFELTSAGATQQGFNFVPPYIEEMAAPEPVLDGDIWFSIESSTLVKFEVLRGMYAISDGIGVEGFGDRAYAFDVSVVAGAPANQPSPKNSPYSVGFDNFISKVGVVSSRGTFKGSNFYSVGFSTLTKSNKQTVMYLLEQVIEDPTGNFSPGEVVLRIETKIEDSGVVRITNDDYDNTNAYDLFRCRARPLGKMKT